jgi:hypothetical protein
MADGSTPPANVDGSFIIGPTHDVPPEMSAQSSLPKGRVIEFTMSSAQSKSIPSLRATPTLSERWIRLTPRSSW